jgi:hypothetical protein
MAILTTNTECKARSEQALGGRPGQPPVNRKKKPGTEQDFGDVDLLKRSWARAQGAFPLGCDFLEISF